MRHGDTRNFPAFSCARGEPTSDVWRTCKHRYYPVADQTTRSGVSTRTQGARTDGKSAIKISDYAIWACLSVSRFRRCQISGYETECSSAAAWSDTASARLCRAAARRYRNPVLGSGPAAFECREYFFFSILLEAGTSI